ncbi:MAG: hypothetical protein JSS68_04905 [Actinobacteria bacterium]|nr:hypothetical protein [Actinomycetota bacterium]
MNGTRRLTVGDVLNEVVALYQQHFGVLVPTAFWLFLPVSILSGAAGQNDVGLFAAAAILTFAVAILYQGVVVSLVRDVQDGERKASVGELLRSVAPVLSTLLVTGILYGIGVLVGFILFIVPGCILVTIWAVIAPVIVIEKGGVGGSFRRSQELVEGHGWTVFGAVITATLITAVATLILTSIAEAIAGGAILRIVLGTLAATLTAPIAGLLAAVLYYRLLALKGPPREAPPQPPPSGPAA